MKGLNILLLAGAFGLTSLLGCTGSKNVSKNLDSEGQKIANNDRRICGEKQISLTTYALNQGNCENTEKYSFEKDWFIDWYRKQIGKR